MKIVIWGTGKVERSIEQYILDSVDIIAFVDNDARVWNSFICIMHGDKYLEIPIISPPDLKELEYDYIVIAAAAYKEIMGQCTNFLEINEDKILQAYELGEWPIQQVKEIFDTNILADRNNYCIGGRRVRMDEDHALPQMQRELMMYDRFVPFLGEVTKEKDGRYVVDIGANIGDTLMAMWDYTNDRFLCIEPTEIFLEKCKANIESLGEGGRVSFEKVFITDQVEEKFMPNIYKSGTAVRERVVGDNEGVLSKSLDDLLIEKNISFKEIDLIKIDTDGFDADCIISGKKVLNEGTALLYWENAIFTYEQYEKYQKAYNMLGSAGYTTFFIFDNCGNFMCKMDIEALKSLSAYLQRINMGWDRITFNYVDVLGCKEIDDKKCQKVIERYLKKYLLCRKKEKGGQKGDATLRVSSR